jgi:multiple sugar transport system permease protein
VTVAAVGRPPSREAASGRSGGGSTRAAWGFVAPALTVLALFFFLPVVAALLLSFTDFDLYALGDASLARFVGTDNYARLFDDPRFWTAMRNTFYFVLLGGPLSVAVSLAAALLVNARLARLRGLFRTVFFAPVVTTLVAAAVVWRYLYHPRFGLFNTVLAALGLPVVDWLGDPRWAMPAIILLAVWKNFGYNMVIFIAGLQSVPETLYEAARIDGAGAWAQFRAITLPVLRPTFVFVGLITMIGYFQLFAEPYVMTPQGGPLQSTLSVVFLMYWEGFRWLELGSGAAVAFVLFAIILAAAILQRLLLREEEA